MAKVKCPLCGKEFDREKQECVLWGKRRYAHVTCAESYSESKDLTPQEREFGIRKKIYESLKDGSVNQLTITDYCKIIFNDKCNYARIAHQISTFTNEYGLKLPGILYSLMWYYELKGEPISQMYDGIGIVPYIYKQAQSYYQKVTEAQAFNNNRIINNPTKEITISAPKRKKTIKLMFQGDYE